MTHSQLKVVLALGRSPESLVLDVAVCCLLLPNEAEAAVDALERDGFVCSAYPTLAGIRTRLVSLSRDGRAVWAAMDRLGRVPPTGSTIRVPCPSSWLDWLAGRKPGVRQLTVCEDAPTTDLAAKRAVGDNAGLEGAAMTTIHDVADYIILRLTEDGAGLNFLKLQKLVYYVQAWSLAFHGQPCFDGKFQAWVHGPVSRELYDRFASRKMIYSAVGMQDIRREFAPDAIHPDLRAHIDAVLEIYSPMSGSQLVEMTHREEPWQNARHGYEPSQRCEREISEDDMARYYAARLPKE